MRPITANSITQTEHGAFKAVDYSSKPDPVAYAPEDVTFVSFSFNGDCGWNLQAQGATGRHGFCHVEEAYIGNNQTITKGQPLFKMGYNGKTIPAGPDGRHAHWVIRLNNGSYVYPPSKITEPFGGSEEEPMLTDKQIDEIISAAYAQIKGEAPRQAEWDFHRKHFRERGPSWVENLLKGFKGDDIAWKRYERAVKEAGEKLKQNPDSKTLAEIKQILERR